MGKMFTLIKHLGLNHGDDHSDGFTADPVKY